MPEYLLIAFIVVVALAPLTHFLPSKRQRRQAALREAAALGGLFVEFRSLPGAAAGRVPQAQQDVIYYGRRLAPSKGRGSRRGAWLQRDGEWRSVGAGPRLPLPEPLQAGAADILGASVDEGSCGVYWQEQGDTATVGEIRDILLAWAQQIP
ncbi:hypothetical protein Q6D67_11950 [Haliea sp. E1-2-M8]|uniref:hypothetical protein n=1 Tax=Haliea sp. E1-2-M8 TaxID=3064706 RepID=UPI00272689C4|nr:hypothetical protein [Haliea sp. E1-2-M8]MDO8862414.1 hypothetical protein [Haliea sp. E1-2-M8]